MTSILKWVDLKLLTVDLFRLFSENFTAGEPCFEQKMILLKISFLFSFIFQKISVIFQNGEIQAKSHPLEGILMK